MCACVLPRDPCVCMSEAAMPTRETASEDGVRGGSFPKGRWFATVVQRSAFCGPTFNRRHSNDVELLHRMATQTLTHPPKCRRQLIYLCNLHPRPAHLTPKTIARQRMCVCVCVCVWMTWLNAGCSEPRAPVAECVLSVCCCVLGVLVSDPGLCCSLRCRIRRLLWQILQVCTHCLYCTVL